MAFENPGIKGRLPGMGIKTPGMSFNPEEDGQNLVRTPRMMESGLLPDQSNAPPQMSAPIQYQRPGATDPLGGMGGFGGFTPSPLEGNMNPIGPQMSNPVEMARGGFKVPGQLGNSNPMPISPMSPSPISGTKSLSSAPSPINSSPISPINPQQAKTQISPPISNPINPSPTRPPMNVPGNPRINPGMRPMKPRMRGPIQPRKSFSTF